jgi:hypothetical protein
VARSHWGSKILWRSVYVVRQIAERERRRIVLEEFLPGLIIIFVLFPISKGGGEWNILWAIEEDMVACMNRFRSAAITVRGEVLMKSLSIFTHRGVSGDGTSHATDGHNIVARQGDEEGLSLFVSNIWFEYLSFPSYWEPTISFVRLGCGQDSPVS